MIECHYCAETFDREQLGSLAKCCIRKCHRYYCIECIQKYFNKQFDMQMYRKDTWICYVCQEVCQCDRCKLAETINAQKKNLRKKNARQKQQQGEESLQQSGSNISQQVVRIDQNQSILQEQQPQIINNDLQDKQKQQSSLPEFKVYTEDEIMEFLPFYQKIAERRNKFYHFILSQCRKRKLIQKDREYQGRETKKQE